MKLDIEQIYTPEVLGSFTCERIKSKGNLEVDSQINMDGDDMRIIHSEDRKSAPSDETNSAHESYDPDGEEEDACDGDDIVEVKLPDIVVPSNDDAHFVKDVCIDEGLNSMKTAFASGFGDHGMSDNFENDHQRHSPKNVVEIEEHTIVCDVKTSLKELLIIETEQIKQQLKELGYDCQTEGIDHDGLSVEAASYKSAEEAFHEVEAAESDLDKEIHHEFNARVLDRIKGDNLESPIESVPGRSTTDLGEDTSGVASPDASTQDATEEVSNTAESGITGSTDSGNSECLAGDQKSAGNADPPGELKSSARNVVRCHSDVQFSGPEIMSAPRMSSGHIMFHGSTSMRSDSSNTSARSFAFPVLQTEWNTSPVRMAKAERRLFRKHGGWRAGLLCCKF